MKTLYILLAHLAFLCLSLPFFPHAARAIHLNPDPLANAHHPSQGPHGHGPHPQGPTEDYVQAECEDIRIVADCDCRSIGADGLGTVRYTNQTGITVIVTCQCVREPSVLSPTPSVPSPTGQSSLSRSQVPTLSALPSPSGPSLGNCSLDTGSTTLNTLTVAELNNTEDVTLRIANSSKVGSRASLFIAIEGLTARIFPYHVNGVVQPIDCTLSNLNGVIYITQSPMCNSTLANLTVQDSRIDNNFVITTFIYKLCSGSPLSTSPSLAPSPGPLSPSLTLSASPSISGSSPVSASLSTSASPAVSPSPSSPIPNDCANGTQLYVHESCTSEAIASCPNSTILVEGLGAPAGTRVDQRSFERRVRSWPASVSGARNITELSTLGLLEYGTVYALIYSTDGQSRCTFFSDDQSSIDRSRSQCENGTSVSYFDRDTPAHSISSYLGTFGIAISYSAPSRDFSRASQRGVH